MMPRTLALAASILGAAMAMWSVPAASQDYPNRPIRVIASQGAGGLSDVFMRALAEELRPLLGEALVIENRTGANGTIGARACAEATPDGYTICILPGEPVLFNPLIEKNVPFDPKILTPITKLFFVTQVLAVNSSLNVKTLAELAALSKAKAGTLSYAAPAIPKVAFMEQFKRETGADIVRVPFKGGGEAVTSMLNGTTPIAFFGLANFLPHLESGQITGLAVDTERRSPQVPQIPTLKEIGYSGDVMPAFFGLFAPPGTPPSIIERLYKAAAAAASKSEFQKRHMIDRGLEPLVNSPAEFARQLAEDHAAAARVVKASGLNP
jgi:tripartite-type tricarboxylate transporter receptor subunit TctC